MSERLVDSQIASLHQLIAALHQRVTAEPVQAAAVLPDLLEDLHTALEELHVAEEEQHQQNEALVAARLVVAYAGFGYHALPAKAAFVVALWQRNNPACRRPVASPVDTAASDHTA